MAKIFKVLDEDKGAISSGNIEQLLDQCNRPRTINIDTFSRSMKVMAKQYKTKLSLQPKKWESVQKYVESDGFVLDSEELEKLELIYQIYEREEKGIGMREKDENATNNKIYGRLGELVGIKPNIKFMGEPQHGIFILIRLSFESTNDR